LSPRQWFDFAAHLARQNIVLVKAFSAVVILLVLLSLARIWFTDWRLVVAWSAGEEFDISQWTLERGFLRNEEEQYYTAGARANFQVSSDGLKLIALRETLPNAAYRKGAGNWKQARAEAHYTSTSLLSKAAWQNVKIEIVASVSGGKGAWPAMWLRSPNVKAFGEIDMMEHIGREPDIVHTAVHYGASLDSRDVKSADRTIPGLQGRDVLYTAALTPDTVTVEIDDQPMMTMDRNLVTDGVRPLQQPFNLIINLALGGAWPGPIDDAALPAVLTIKSIRIWEWRRTPKAKVLAASDKSSSDKGVPGKPVSKD
jgi:beta-glucanase (GH16 family)